MKTVKKRIMKERLIEFLAYLGIGQTRFEESAGLSRGFVNTLKDNMTLKSLKKITDTYPVLNEKWLKTGEGNMIKIRNKQQIKNVSRSKVTGSNVNGDGNNVTQNDLTGVLSLPKEYLELLKKKEEQLGELIAIANKLADRVK